MMCWMKNIFIVLRIETLDVVWTKQLKHHTRKGPLDQHRDQRKLNCLLFFCFQVKSYYNIMMETIKQTSFQNIQGDLGGHMETLSVKDGGAKAQQALTLHKVDMEASVMEVSLRKVCFNLDLIKFPRLVLSATASHL